MTVTSLAGAAPKALEFWESEHDFPQSTILSEETHAALVDCYRREIEAFMAHPFLPSEEIRALQLQRLRQLVEHAYASVPLYREKYRAAGFGPRDLQTWDDFRQLPVVTKSELIAAFPDRCLSSRYQASDLFGTRSSGSTGQTLLIRVDRQAILTDTVHGVRQMALQSGMRYAPDHLVTHVYTTPWWFDRIGDAFPAAFISNLIPAHRSSRILRGLRSHILSCYPTTLQALLPHADAFAGDPLYLVVTHSEQSTRAGRSIWSEALGVPVLDEYSSEEATRMALELPCGHYHVCEDAVYLEVLDSHLSAPQSPGTPGNAVVTNLLNEAMPFIRYVQGDYITQPAEPGPCAVRWDQVSGIGGRANDSFVSRHGWQVPAGTVLDITYRWMMDCGVYLQEFEIVQERTDLVRVRVFAGCQGNEARLRATVGHLAGLFGVSLDHQVEVVAELAPEPLRRSGKARPIRRTLHI